jgi:beta-galactosidase
MREAMGVRGPLRTTAARPPSLPPARLALTPRAGLLAGLRAVPAPAVEGVRPASFERLGLDTGMVLYRAHPRIPAGEHRLTLTAVHDRATVFVDGERLGTGLPIRGRGLPVRLEVLVENLGRVNYGPALGGHKGLLGPVLVDRRTVQGWESLPVALQEWSTSELDRAVAAGQAGAAAGFATATVTVAEPADTFLALPGSRRGLVWVNGFLLGRYWDIGPQVTLYCPAPLLRAGANTVTVLELEGFGGVLELRDRPELGPPEEYVEEFD